MHFVIMGCGRVGASMASQLDRNGHSVAVIDRSSDAFRRLPKSFSGRKIKGLGFDKDALTQAGIDEAYAFAAVSSGDNSNIIAARVARETFGVEHVVARIYDAQRADVYERLGIPTVATVRHTADQMMHRMIPTRAAHEAQDVSGAVSLVDVVPHTSWVGITVDLLEHRLDVRVAWLSRQGTPVLARGDMLLQDGDHLHLAVATAKIPALQRSLSRPWTKEDDE